jgi:hypothetical protein
MAEEIAYQVALVSAKGNQKLHKRLRVGDKTLMRYASYFCPVPEQLEFSCAVYERTQNPAQILQILKAYPTLLDSVDEETIQCIAKTAREWYGKTVAQISDHVVSGSHASCVSRCASVRSSNRSRMDRVARRLRHGMCRNEGLNQRRIRSNQIRTLPTRLGCGPITTSQNDV